MSNALLLLVPLGALAYLIGIGAGAASWLTPRFPADAQAAMAVVVGAALVAVSSAFVPLGVPPRPLALAVAAAGAAMTVACGRRVVRAVRAGAVPVGVAACAIALAGAPALARGSWQAASLYGSTDPYHWSSQARQYLDGPVAEPMTEHPDRLTYERSTSQRWAFALSYGVLEIAWFTGADPPDVYEALAAVVFALLPLAAFACARACFGWRRLWAALVALALVANADLLYATHFSWQQQLAGTAFLFAGATALRLALEREAGRREALLAALLTAGSLASYRLGFSPYFAGLLASVVIVYGWLHRAEIRRIGARVGAFLAGFGLLAAPSIVAVLVGFGDFYSSGSFSTTQKRAFPDGQVAEALGLVPRLWAREQGWSDVLAVAWLVVASLGGAVALIAGYRVLRRARVARADFLATGVAITLGLYCVFLLPSFASYLSFKVLAYGAPFLLLLVLAPAALGRVPAPVAAAAAVVVAALVIPSAAVATAVAIDETVTPGELPALADARLRANAPVSVALDDPWEQIWALYYLRDHPISVEHASFVLTGEGRRRQAEIFRHRPVDYVLARNTGGSVVWRRGSFTVSACTEPRERALAGACR